MTIEENSNQTSLSQKVEEIINAQVMKPHELEALSKALQNEMEKGLRAHNPNVPMFPSFISKRPTGHESGKVLAVDLGGTNLRCCLFDLQGQGKYTVQQSHAQVPDSIKKGSFSGLSDFVADAVVELVNQYLPEHNHSAEKEALKLGYAFSFACISEGVSDGMLESWASGYTCPDAIGQSPTKFLQASLDKKSANIKVTTLMNDVVGTLMSSAYKNPKTAIGMILGTGFNIGFYEKVSNILHWPTEKAERAATDYHDMVIDTEMCALNPENINIPLTKYENKMDSNTTNPGVYVCEKIIGGMYIGETTRHAILDLVSQNLLFGGKLSEKFGQVWGFAAKQMSRMEVDTSDDLCEVGKVLEQELGVEQTSLEDRQAVLKLVSATTTKSAQYTACCLAATISHLKAKNDNPDEEFTVGIDGSLFAKYPNYEKKIYYALGQLLGPQVQHNIHLERTEDGSGLGVAVVAKLYDAST